MDVTRYIDKYHLRVYGMDRPNVATELHCAEDDKAIGREKSL